MVHGLKASLMIAEYVKVLASIQLLMELDTLATTKMINVKVRALRHG